MSGYPPFHKFMHTLPLQNGSDAIFVPLGPALHYTEPKEHIQFNHIEILKSTYDEKHVLMLRDNHSGYRWFDPFPDQTAEFTANALLD